MNIFTTAVLFCTDGWNNNPTAKQFQHTYKRLVCHRGAEPGTTGNVSPLDDTQVVIQALPESSATDEDTVCVEQQCRYLELPDHTYDTKTLGSLLENIVCYIAGKFCFTLTLIQLLYFSFNKNNGHCLIQINYHF